MPSKSVMDVARPGGLEARNRILGHLLSAPWQTRIGVSLLALLLTVSVSGVLLVRLVPGNVDLRVGEPAPRTILAPQSITYVSHYLTEQQRQQAAARVAPVYRLLDADVVRQQLALARGITDYLDAVRSDAYATPESRRQAIESIDKLKLSPSAIKGLMARVTVWVVPNTSVIRLTVDDTDPRLAAALANEIVAVFVEGQRESGSGRGRDIAIVEPAIEPLEPIAPRKLLNTLLAAVGGCALAVAIALLIEYFDDTLVGVEDVKEHLPVPLLAAIPRSGRRRKRRGALVAVADSGSTLAEAYRFLHTGIQLPGQHGHSDSHGGHRTLIITSPVSREEKGDIAANLAMVMAQSGQKVLLVDADAEQPHLHEALGLANKAGLSTWLARDGDCQEYIVMTDVPGLQVLCGGPRLEPAKRWSPQRMGQLIQALKAKAEIVIFDAPPVLAMADAMVLASQVDATILAIGSGYTRQSLALQAIERLKTVQAKELGVVLNRAPGGPAKQQPRQRG